MLARVRAWISDKDKSIHPKLGRQPRNVSSKISKNVLFFFSKWNVFCHVQDVCNTFPSLHCGQHIPFIFKNVFLDFFFFFFCTTHSFQSQPIPQLFMNLQRVLGVWGPTTRRVYICAAPSILHSTVVDTPCTATYLPLMAT